MNGLYVSTIYSGMVSMLITLPLILRPPRGDLDLRANKQKADSAAWLNTVGFDNVQGYNYWSATTRANHLEHAWRVQMNFGYWLGSGKLVNAYVWPVRN